MKKGILTRKELDLLYHLSDCTIVGLGENKVIYVKQDGIFVLDTTKIVSNQIDLSNYEPFDELIFLPDHNIYCFVDKKTDHIFIQLAQLNISGNFYLLNELKIDLERGVVGGLYTNNASIFGVITKENGEKLLWHVDFIRDEKQQWITHMSRHLLPNYFDSPIDMTDKIAVFGIDCTPFDPFFEVYCLQSSKKIISFSSHSYLLLDSTIIWINNDEKEYGISVFNATQGLKFYISPGYVSYILKNGQEIFAVIYKNGSEIVYELKLTNESLKFEEVWKESGRKTLFSIDKRLLALRRDARSGVKLHEITRKSTKAIRNLTNFEDLQIKVDKIKSPNGAEAILFTTDSNKKTTVLHFHGGPEAYEVEELRFFGAFRTSLLNGINLVSLNYRGSKGLGKTFDTAAWQRWHEVFPEDLEWILQQQHLFDCNSIILAGWSFGASLALIASQLIKNAKGVIAGGTMANLTHHAKRAAGVNENYRDWFDNRFGSHVSRHENYSFFNLYDKLIKPLPVISFHGKKDEHCSYKDLIELVHITKKRGFEWNHYDLPGKSHYAINKKDAYLIYRSTINFVKMIICHAGDK